MSQCDPLGHWPDQIAAVQQSAPLRSKLIQNISGLSQGRAGRFAVA
jgi:hypothetical protein